jgi:hypothetical protein
MLNVELPATATLALESTEKPAGVVRVFVETEFDVIVTFLQSIRQSREEMKNG